MRTQLDDLRAEIRLCEVNKKQAAQEKDIQKWRYWDMDGYTFFILYN